MFYATRATPFGPFTLVGNEQGIVRADFQNGARPVAIDSAWRRDDAPLREALEALEAYCAGEPQRFAFHYNLRGTPFQQQVWQALLNIPQGTLSSYRELAEQLGRLNGFRAVGAAVGRNPVSLFVPCHRVVGSNGALTGYAGGLPLKEALLRHEGALR
jgi:methylated-DNA-[protein]-cysteine S-methyltransferase